MHKNADDALQLSTRHRICFMTGEQPEPALTDLFIKNVDSSPSVFIVGGHSQERCSTSVPADISVDA